MRLLIALLTAFALLSPAPLASEVPDDPVKLVEYAPYQRYVGEAPPDF